MNKTKIEWCDYTINPVKGLCPMACSYCYARRMYKRFHWDPTIRYECLSPMPNPKKPSRIFVGSTIDLFHDLTNQFLPDILSSVSLFPEHTFIFLTKCPQNLPKEFPDNCWVGQSLTCGESDWVYFYQKLYEFEKIKAAVKFISFEPLLGHPDLPNIPYLARAFKDCGINWLIIGQQTPIRKETTPKIEWVKEIVEAAIKAKIPVFLKDNLKPLVFADPSLVDVFTNHFFELRQEFPLVGEK